MSNKTYLLFGMDINGIVLSKINMCEAAEYCVSYKITSSIFDTNIRERYILFSEVLKINDRAKLETLKEFDTVYFIKDIFIEKYANKTVVSFLENSYLKFAILLKAFNKNTICTSEMDKIC